MEKYIDTIKEQAKLKNVLIILFVGMVGFILGTITNMIYTYNTIERLLIRWCSYTKVDIWPYPS